VPRAAVNTEPAVTKSDLIAELKLPDIPALNYFGMRVISKTQPRGSWSRSILLTSPDNVDWCLGCSAPDAHVMHT
jgi:hypothetical protein